MRRLLSSTRTSSPRPSASGSTSAVGSVGIALFGGTQITLTLLEKLMDSFPLPMVKGLAGAGVEVIKMIRVIQSNKKECNELQKRSASLLVVVLDSLKSKKEEELPDELKQGMERLTSNFLEVISELKVVEKRSSKGSVTELSRSILYHHDNAEVLKGCMAKLDWAMQEFQVKANIDSSLKDLKRHEELVHGQAQLQQGVAELLQGQAKLLDATKDKANDNMLSDLPSIQLPANPRSFFGRQDFVESGVQVLMGTQNAHLAILGPGGMGKTSAALKIVHDSRVIDRFGEYIIWVPCEQATSIPLLFQLLARSIHLSTSTSPDRFKEIIKALRSIPALVLLLDNFETLWDIPGKQSDVGDILACLAQIPSVSLILTMRGSYNPASESVDWAELPPLTKLELSAAREAFLKICPSASNDTQLDALLEELDCVPLAITLMAHMTKRRETPSDLLSRWRSERIKRLSKLGGDRRNSIDTSIQLSLDSNLVKATPGTMELLSVIAKLPAGANTARLPEICQSIPNWRAALNVLDEIALTYGWTDKSWVHILSPIRSYIQLYHPLQGVLLKDLQQAYCALAEKGSAVPGDSEFLSNVKEISEEEANIEAVVIEALSLSDQVGDMALNASLNYSRYCYWTHPQTTVISLAVAAAQTSSAPLLPKCLQSLGDILYMLSKYDEATSAFEDARATFVKLGNQMGAAQCLQSLGDILRMQSKYDEARSAFEDARATFFKLGDQIGAARCLHSLGNILHMQDKYDEARSALEDARATFFKLGDQIGAAQCLQSLGDILYIQSKYDEARSAFEDARATFLKLGDQIGVARCLHSLGNILHMQGKYDEARSAFEDARANFLKLGHQTEAALFLQSLDNILSQSGLGQYPKSLSNAHLMQGQYDEAISTLDDAQDTKSSAESTSESSDAIGTLQSQEETAMYIEEMVECVHVFELSALYIAQQGVRRACAFRAWSLILEEQMELGLKQTRSTHEKIGICRQLLDFQIQTSDRQKSLDRHLNIVKQLFEVLTDCEITNVVSPENISTAVIMSWVIINSAEELEHMVDDKRHAAFSKAVRRDAIQFLRLEGNYGQTNSDLKVKFSHIYDTLLQEYVRRVNTLNSNDGVIEAPPLRRYYTLTELIRLAAGHLSFLKDMENDLGMLWTCSPSSPHQRITNDSSFPRSSQQKFSHTTGCSELPTSFQPFESTSLQQTQKPAYVSSSEALHTPSTEQRTWTVRDFVSCPSSESPKPAIQNFEEQNTSDVIDPLWLEAKNYYVQQLHPSDVAVISHHDLTKRISIDTSIHRGDATHLYKGTIREDGPEIKVATNQVAVRILQAMRNPSTRTTFGKRFFQDFQIWISLRHPNLVPFLGFTTQSDLPYALVSPWYRNSNIGDYLRHLWPGKVQIRTQLIRDIAEGIGYLHAIKIVHGDIQMNTVLVDDNGVARVAEPGILHFVKDISSYGGTPRTNFQNYRFLAPELLDVDDPTIKSDIWAFGCLASLILTSRVPYNPYDNLSTVKLAIIQGELPYLEASQKNHCDYATSSLWEVISSCWSLNPMSRDDMPGIRNRLQSIKPIEPNTSAQSSRHHDNSSTRQWQIFSQSRFMSWHCEDNNVGLKLSTPTWRSVITVEGKEYTGVSSTKFKAKEIAAHAALAAYGQV